MLHLALWTLLAFPAFGNPSVHQISAPQAAQPANLRSETTTRSPHGPKLTVPCENCHSAAAWRPIKRRPEFDHNQTKYPLRGMHEGVKCTLCHLNPVFTNVGMNCIDCHADVHRRQMGTDCAQCHTVKGWSATNQQVKDHQNRFPLFGAHAAVPCEECHKQAATGIFYGLSTRCDSCHLKDWQTTTNPAHPSAGQAFASGNCQGCHKFDSWLGASFDHSATGFPLTAGHASVPCASCHINNNYNLQIGPTDCGNAGCHLTTWQQTTNPVHPSAGTAFAASNCSQCHNTTAWTTATFDHSTTGFALTNGHANVPCASCHINNNYTLTIAPTDCGNAGCHLSTWQQTNNPVHSTSGTAFAAANCVNCHSTTGWDTASFDHSVTGFALVGTHMSPTPTPCASCHVNNNYTLSSADCMGCHQTAWNSTQTLGGSVPNHVAAAFPTSATACSSCHTITVWADGKFDHGTTGFPLTNSHQLAPAGKVTACTQCHINGNYTLTIQPTDCGNSGCHLTTWQTTNNPTHSAAGTAFAAANCSTCHDTIIWTDFTFDHSVTGWPLTGSHQLAPAGKVVACTDCHVNNNYTFTSANTDCYGCHQTAWNSTQTLGGSIPNHITAGFPTSQCSTCHDMISWADGKFDHSTTGFALVGTHSTTACALCHVNNNYSLTSANTDCMSCHQTAWNSTQTLGGNVPNHITSNFPQTAAACSSCHTITVWADGKFDHSTTGFPLTNSHQLAPAGKVTACTQCHINGNYTLTIQPTDCGNSGCHLTTWQTTNNPTHSAAGSAFAAANCSTCHDTIAWTDATFDHSVTGWPLTGSHQLAPAGKVVACTDCHVNNNYTFTSANTDCYGCHQTAWNSTQTLGGSIPNHITAGFPTSQCSTCHDMISWADGKFDHSTTGFALVGTHSTTACALCHVNNNYSLTSANTDCMSCHQTAWNSTQTLGGSVPNHVAAAFPTSATACSSCHTITVWADGKFDHGTTGFPLTNSHQLAPAGKVTACTQCHINGNYTLTIQPTDCGNSGCHLTTWQTTNNPTHSAAGTAFAAANCSTCHDTIIWTDFTFDHSVTGWPLTGSHQLAPAGKVVACTDCHVNNNYTFTSANTDCYGCHQTAWNSTQTLGGSIPNHITAGFPTSQCSTCHDMISWADGKFDHSTTGFALVGTHSTTACALCHVNNNYSLTSANTDCMSCHQTAWNSTQTLGGNVPNHITSNFPQTAAACSSCHTITVWADGKFDHSTTGFPLTNSHQLAPAGKVTACTQCHINGNYTLTIQPTDCGNSGCHLTTWQTTNNPTHSAAGTAFAASNCSTCHDTIAWTDATFDHSVTGWPLDGFAPARACRHAPADARTTTTTSLRPTPIATGAMRTSTTARRLWEAPYPTTSRPASRPRSARVATPRPTGPRPGATLRQVLR